MRTNLIGIMAALVACCVVVWAGGCSTPAKQKDQRSLYDRLGGEPAIRAVVDDFVPRAASNPRVNFTRSGMARQWAATDTNVAHLKDRLVEFVAVAAGGPQTYRGLPMRDSHAGMGITNAEFDALAGDLKASLDALRVPAREQAELMAAVEGTRADIVEVR